MSTILERPHQSLEECILEMYSVARDAVIKAEAHTVVTYLQDAATATHDADVEHFLRALASTIRNGGDPLGCEHYCGELLRLARNAQSSEKGEEWGHALAQAMVLIAYKTMRAFH